MTIDEFLIEFERCVKEDTEVKWIYNDTRIRGTRFKERIGDDDVLYCPITFVYSKLTRKYLPPGRIDDAVADMKMSFDAGDDIMWAADSCPESTADLRRSLITILERYKCAS